MSVPRVESRVGAAVGFLAFVELCSGLLQGYVPVLAGDIGAKYGVSAAGLNWLNAVLLLSAAVSVPVLAKCGDLFGHRRLLRIAVILVLVGSVLVAVAPNYGLFLTGRALQGPFAAFIPLEVALVRGRLSGEAARRGIGYLVSALAFGAIIGSATAGLADAALPSVGWTLAVPALLLAVCAVIVFTLVPAGDPAPKDGPRRIDVAGFAGLSVAIAALLFGLAMAPKAGWTAPAVLLCLGVAVVVGACWVAWELRAAAPAVNLRMVRRAGLGLPFAAALCFGVGIYGAQVANTTFLASSPATAGYGLGLTPAKIGFVTLAMTLGATVFAALCARVARRIGPYVTITAGLALIAVAYMTLVVLHTQVWHFVLAHALVGAGMGLASGTYPALVTELSPAADAGIATGLYNTLRSLGGSIAGAAFAVLLSAFLLPDTGVPSLSGYLTLWAVLAGVLLVGVVFMAVAARRQAPTADRLASPAEQTVSAQAI
ncbi:MFS transporter [Streptomyces sp. NRRL S-646]|uniref:MFS transporter n=1 Tax=Streptomyces sp. NRRL S-646 TaxID=1463917 RepID=UPI000691E64D|nr:MFS transporter [Streptomyces sp. NRRL S-646]